MKVTYYLEVLSSWCYWSEPTWAELKARYTGRAEFDWKIALMRKEDFPVSREQADWFYRRSGMVMRSPVMLNSGWMEKGANANYAGADLVAEACKDFGFTDDTIRPIFFPSISEAWERASRIDVAVDVAANESG